MKKFWIFPITLISIATLMVIVDIMAVKDGPEHIAESEQTHPTTEPSPRSDLAQHPKPDTRLTRLPDGHVEYKPALEVSRSLNSTTSPRESLELIEQLLSHYRFAYKENPVGVENFEITEQLLGKNPKKIVFIASDSEALRGNELIDQWDTPYFFHAQSGQQMDIRSAGPDQTLWTEDDITLDPTRASQ